MREPGVRPVTHNPDTREHRRNGLIVDPLMNQPADVPAQEWSRNGRCSPWCQTDLEQISPEVLSSVVARIEKSLIWLPGASQLMPCSTQSIIGIEDIIVGL